MTLSIITLSTITVFVWTIGVTIHFTTKISVMNYYSQHNNCQHDDTQHDDILHNGTRYNGTLHYDTYHNDTQHWLKNVFSRTKLRSRTIFLFYFQLSNRQHRPHHRRQRGQHWKPLWVRSGTNVIKLFWGRSYKTLGWYSQHYLQFSSVITGGVWYFIVSNLPSETTLCPQTVYCNQL